mgnify:CR=1 FL=1
MIKVKTMPKTIHSKIRAYFNGLFCIKNDDIFEYEYDSLVKHGIATVTRKGPATNEIYYFRIDDKDDDPFITYSSKSLYKSFRDRRRIIFKFIINGRIDPCYISKILGMNLISVKNNITYCMKMSRMFNNVVEMAVNNNISISDLNDIFLTPQEDVKRAYLKIRRYGVR